MPRLLDFVRLDSRGWLSYTGWADECVRPYVGISGYDFFLRE